MKKGKERWASMGEPTSALGDGVKTMLPKEIERHRADNSKIHWGIAITQGCAVLFQDHIFDSREALCNVPMLLHTLSKACGIPVSAH